MFRESLAICLSLAAGTSAAQTLLNPGFEDPGIGFQSVAPGATLGHWTNAGPSDIEFVHAVSTATHPGLEFSAYEGEYWIDLVGIGAPSAIYQDIPDLDEGSSYQISWAQSGNVWGPDFSFGMEVVWNGAVVASNSQIHGGSDGSMMDWQEYTVDVVAGAGDNRLMFRATSGTSARGAALDGVGIVEIPAPSSAVALSLAALGCSRRRR